MTDIIVEVEQGKLRGTIGTDYYGGEFKKFLGVPYAKAPIGELRFKVRFTIVIPKLIFKF